MKDSFCWRSDSWLTYFFFLSSLCLLALFLMRSQLLILLRFSCRWWVVFLFLLSRISLRLWTLLLWCVWVWICSHFPYLEFIKLFGDVNSRFSSSLGKFSAIISQKVFLLLSLSPLLWDSHYACVGILNGVSHFSKALFIFLHSFLSVSFRLHNLYQSTQKFADSFWTDVDRGGGIGHDSNATDSCCSEIC